MATFTSVDHRKPFTPTYLSFCDTCNKSTPIADIPAIYGAFDICWPRVVCSQCGNDFEMPVIAEVTP